MVDSVEMVPVDDQDIEERVFRGWEEGKGPWALSREFGIPIRRVEEIVDRCLPAFDAQNQLRAFKRELRRLEVLSTECFLIAKRDKNPEFTHLFARLNERVCAMRGIGNIRMDPLQVEVAQQPSRHNRIVEAINRLWEQQPAADKAVHERVKQLGSTKALELLGLLEPEAPKANGNGSDPDPILR
jgi:hypothetical protein